MRITLNGDVDQKKGTALPSQSHRLIERILLCCYLYLSVNLDKIARFDQEARNFGRIVQIELTIGTSTMPLHGFFRNIREPLLY